jgi:hypothetical protein
MIRQPYDLDLAREHQRELRVLSYGPATERRAIHPMRAEARSSIARPSVRRSPRGRLNRIARRVERLILGAAMELVAAVLERRIVRACVAERGLSRAVAAGRP